jgi:hypothetical protein
MFDPIALDLREQSSGAIFAMARTFADQIEAANSLTLVLVTGDIIEARDTVRIARALVERAVEVKHRAIARRLFNAYTSRSPMIGALPITFEDVYGTD